MKILVIGAGGREHALAWKLSESAGVEEVYVSPGSLAMTDVASVIPAQNDMDYVEPVSYYTSPSPRDRQKSRMPSSA